MEGRTECDDIRESLNEGGDHLIYYDFEKDYEESLNDLAVNFLRLNDLECIKKLNLPLYNGSTIVLFSKGEFHIYEGPKKSLNMRTWIANRVR